LTPYDCRYFLGIIIKESDTLLIPFKVIFEDFGESIYNGIGI